MAKLAEIKTKQNEASVEGLINAVATEQKKEDSHVLLKMMEKASKEQPKLWGSSIIGFGKQRFKSPSGREVEWFLVGFSPRKANITIYLLNVAAHTEALQKLGKYKTGDGCLYVNKLSDIDIKVLEQMVSAALIINKARAV